MAVNFVPDTFQGTPGMLPPCTRVGGRIRTVLGILAAPAPALNDVWVFAKLPSDCVLLEYSVGHDDMDTGGVPTLAFDYGVCDKDGNDVNPGASDSREVFANNVVETGAVALTDRRFAGTTAAQVANMAQPLWQVAGMLADPARPLFLCARIGAAAQTPAAGNIFWRIRFVEMT